MTTLEFAATLRRLGFSLVRSTPTHLVLERASHHAIIPRHRDLAVNEQRFFLLAAHVDEDAFVKVAGSGRSGEHGIDEPGTGTRATLASSDNAAGGRREG